MDEATFYQRQVILKEVGLEGQAKLKASRVLILGAGGLGHPVASYLAASGVGHITICDFDLVEQSNLHRQVLFTPEDIGKLKSNVLASRIKKQNPFIQVSTINEKIDARNIESCLSDIDIIVDCCDNFATKFLLHDSAFLLKKDLVQASIYQMEGQIQVFAYKTLGKDKGCLRCLWPSVPQEGCVGNCAVSGVIGAVAGVLGTFQAMEVLKLICSIGEVATNTTKTVNLLNMQIDSIKWNKNKACVLCSDKASILSINSNEYTRNKEFVITEVNTDKFVYIDLRNKLEIQETPSQITATNLPYSEFEKWQSRIDKTDQMVFFCQKGIRSQDIVNRLRKLGYDNCFSFANGVPRQRL